VPNHVTHRVLIKGPKADIQRLIEEYVVEEDREIDFNRVIPMPEQLENVEASSYGTMGYTAWYGPDEAVGEILTYPWARKAGLASREDLQEHFQKENPHFKEMADIYKRNIEIYGTPTWYEWSFERRGTDSDGYDFKVVREGPGGVELLFKTAWSPPTPVFIELSRLFPRLDFQVRSFDEGWMFACEGGFHAGESTYLCGEATERLYRLVYGKAPKEEE
jgi:hypothetical protein